MSDAVLHRLRCFTDAASGRSLRKMKPDALRARRFPMRTLGGAIALTLILVGVAAANTWRMYAGFRQLASRDIRLVELAGRITHLDEVLTMSARLSAVSGDLWWESRYLAHEPVLDAAIKETISLAPDAYTSENAAATDAANLALVDLEKRAFAAVHDGHRDAPPSLR